MGRPPKLRFNKSFENEYKKLVRNTKAKIKRTQKNYGKQALDLIPDDIKNIKNLNEVSNKEQANERLERMKKFTQSGSPNYRYKKNKYGVVATEAEINQAKRATKKAQRRAKDIIEKAEQLDIYRQGEKTGEKVGQEMQKMQRPNAGGINMPADFNFNKLDSRSRFEKKKANMEKRAKPDHYKERNKIMRDNFIEHLEWSLNDEGDKLVDALKQMNPDDFYEMYLQFPEDFDFEMWDSDGYNYLEGSKANQKAKEMMHYVERWEKDYKSDVSIF